MAFANFFKNLTACISVILLASCVHSPSKQTSTDFNRAEAAKARIQLALAYLEQNDFPKAKENIDKALAHDQQDYLPHSVLAYYYQQIGEVNQARSAYQQAIKLSAEQGKSHQARPDVLNNYGTFLCKQGEYTPAYQQFELALKSDEPYYHQADTLENLALCADMQANLAKRQTALAELAKLDKARAEQLQRKWQ